MHIIIRGKNRVYECQFYTFKGSLMKKLLIISCITAPVLLLAGNTVKKNNPVEQKGNSQVTQRIKTGSGLEYEVIEKGEGASPRAGQRVTVHYTGYLNNNGKEGAKFDSSVDRNQPFTFTIGVGQVIRGWDEGVMSMKIGEKRRLFIPAELGYGSRGAAGVIPPNAGLIFEVRLISIS
jgi:FKBP-type peptidyl-prolyl cis-trans isomerase